MLLQLVEPGQMPESFATERKVAIGIDLGTTHSVAAMVIDGRPVAMRLEGGSPLIPSAVTYGETTHVGQQALGNEGTLTSIKRLMGRGFDDPVVAQFPQAVSGESAMVKLKVSPNKTVTPIEVSADILRYIKEKAEVALDESIEQAVITVPAYFDDAARAATKDAARLAGLEVLRLINEPTAAALAYGLENNVEGVYAIYDLGGGTFDISLLKLEKGVFQVLATGGDLTLGGDDVDRALCESLNIELTLKNIKAIQASKEALSEAKEVTAVIGGKKYLLTRSALENACKPLIDETIAITRSVLADAGVIPTHVEGVVLVGGSTRLQSVIDAVETCFDKSPLTNINPDEAIALGAAVQAHGLTEGSDNLLLDVIPLSLGLETMGEIVEKILHRNSPIPAMARQEFTTYQDGQTGLVIHVVQGEREFVGDCRSLARFELTGIPPLPAGVARIEIQFNVDADGLLTVSASELTTGISQQVEVKPSYGLTPDEMAHMLEQSLKHGRDDMEKRLLQEAWVEAKRLLHDVKGALEQDGNLLHEEEKSKLLVGMQNLTSALNKSDRHAIIAFHEALDQATQGFAENRMTHQMKQGFVGMNMDALEEIS